MGFATALSGLRAASTNLQVTGNNIANSQTTGFKESRAQFADVYASSIGGVAKTQPGAGVKVTEVAQQFNQGNIESTQNSLDLAISGNGFFVLADDVNLPDPANPTAAVDPSVPTSYTRDGSFKLDNTGNVVNSQGKYLLAFAPNGTTAAEGFSVGVFRPMTIDTAQGLPNSTENINIRLNINSSAVLPTTTTFDSTDTTSYNNTTSVTTYDSQGNSHIATTYYVKTPIANTWDAYLFVDGYGITSGGMAVPPNAAAASTVSSMINEKGLPVPMIFNDSGLLEDVGVLVAKTESDTAVSVAATGVTTGGLAADAGALADAALGVSATLNASAATTANTAKLAAIAMASAASAANSIAGTAASTAANSARTLAAASLAKATASSEAAVSLILKGATAISASAALTVSRAAVAAAGGASADLYSAFDISAAAAAVASAASTTADTASTTAATAATTAATAATTAATAATTAATTLSTDSDAIDLANTDISSTTVASAVAALLASNIASAAAADAATATSLASGLASSAAIAAKAAIVTYNVIVTAAAVGFTAVTKVDFGDIDLSQIDPTTSVAPMAFDIDFFGSTQFGTPFNVKTMNQDGLPAGNLTGIDVDGGGIVFAKYSNGGSKALGQVALARFQSNQDLAKLGDTTWSQTSTSGQPIFGAAGDNNFGSIQASALEGSNVDLSAQLVKLIVAQQAYQASSQTITTEKTLIETILRA